MNKFLEKQEALFERIIQRGSSIKKSFNNIPMPHITHKSTEDNILIDNTLNVRKISMKNTNEDDNLELTIMNLSIFEEERELINLRSTLAKNILPTLNLIDITDVK